MRERDDDFHPKIEETRLKELLEVARKQRDRTLEKEITKKLVKLYVSQGEYFKMGDKPDLNIAKRYLEKALQMQNTIQLLIIAWAIFITEEVNTRKPFPFLKEHWTVQWKRN